MNIKIVSKPEKVAPKRYKNLIESIDEMNVDSAIEINDITESEIPRLRFALWMHYGKSKVKTKYYKNNQTLLILKQ
jgi:hypothetical protein